MVKTERETHRAPQRDGSREKHRLSTRFPQGHGQVHLERGADISHDLSSSPDGRLRVALMGHLGAACLRAKLFHLLWPQGATCSRPPRSPLFPPTPSPLGSLCPSSQPLQAAGAPVHSACMHHPRLFSSHLLSQLPPSSLRPPGAESTSPFSSPDPTRHSRWVCRTNEPLLPVSRGQGWARREEEA